jgi:biopolymer transport protein ExbB
VLAIIEAAGWPIWPLILASVVAVAIIIERAYSLRIQEVAPGGLLLETIKNYQERGVTQDLVTKLADGSPLGRIFRDRAEKRAQLARSDEGVDRGIRPRRHP